MPLQATSGTASYDGFGGGVAAVPNYIEDVFSTYLYTGNNTARSITNNIDLSTKGGLVWIKERTNAGNHYFVDTVRGNTKYISSAGSAAQLTFTDALTAFTTTGFNLGVDASAGDINGTNQNYGSWTFRKQPKFFDVVTYTGNDVSGRAIAHGLGSIPGCIIVKRTDSAVSWQVYHRSLPTNGANGVYNLVLNTTGGQLDNGQFTAVADATNFYVGPYSGTNASGGTYVAYIFAHNAGGFGLTGTDNVISCGSFTTDGSGNATVNLGYEPQWVLYKKTSATGGWIMFDIMRGMTTKDMGNDAYLFANLSLTEGTDNVIYPTATGFGLQNQTGSETYIYIAIRRGPMKVPTSGTSVFAPVTYTGNATARTLTTNFPVDLNTSFYRPGYTGNTYFMDRLRGSNISGSAASLLSSSTAAEGAQTGFGFASNTGIQLGTSAFNGTGETYINYMMQRAPSFFDEVCYTYDGSTTTFNHNLGVPPELIITKQRNQVYDWYSWGTVLGANQFIILNSNAAATAYTFNTTVTSTTFNDALASSGRPKVAYLFASCPGVSKVGSYTGNGSTQTINCGFTGGARFVLVKRTDSTGDWYVWDTARGMVSGTDPSLLLNSTAAEVNANSIYTTTGGFQIVSTAAGINASGGTYIYLAIA